MSFTGNHVARIAILSVAFIFCILGLFLSWWVLETRFNGMSQDAEAKPFDAGEFADDNDDEGDEDQRGLSDEVIVTGILATLATLAVLAYLVLELLPVLGKNPQPLPRLVLAFLAIGLGLAAILYTTFAWPEGMGGDMSFFDETTFDTGGFFGGGGSGRITTSAGFGWWLALIGTVVLPLTAFIAGLSDQRSRPTP